MCGRICNASNNLTIMIAHMAKIPKEIIRMNSDHSRYATRDIPLSRWKFMRAESIDLWRQKTGDRLVRVELLVDSFYERTTKFLIPEGYVMLGMVFPESSVQPDGREATRQVLSIVTQDPINPVFCDPNLDQLHLAVSKVHHRVPVLIKAAA